MIKLLLESFYKDGILDDTVALVTSREDLLTTKQKEFIKKYFYIQDKKFINEVSELFPRLAKFVLSTTIKITQINLMEWLRSMVKDYFGYSIKKAHVNDKKLIRSCIINKTFNLATSDMKGSDTNSHDFKLTIKGNVFRVYCYKQHMLKYLELLLNARYLLLDTNFINLVMDKYQNYPCNFKELHGNSTFSDIVASYGKFGDCPINPEWFDHDE
jgi:hypothetical protein